MGAKKAPHGLRQSAVRRRARRTGAKALSLLAVTVTAAIVLARHYHLGVAATLVAILGGLPGLYLAWAAYRDDRRAETETAAGNMSLAEVADELATSVSTQWAAEAAIRRLNDPPLPVRWVAADALLADEWPLLVTLATSGAGWPVPHAPGAWAMNASELAGEGGDITGVLARVPTCRLAILGEPGAGKTMLLLRLVLDLLARRESGGPVPMLVSLASWDPVGQDWREWLTAQMTIDHPALAAPATPGAAGITRAETLLARGLILPILDGLDEMPDLLWGTAIARINDALRPGEAVVVSSRNAAYRTAVRPLNGPAVTLRGAAVVEMKPVDAATAGTYLLHDAGNAARWAPVLSALGTSTPAGQALATPLMLSLARATYNPRPGEHAGALRDPAELCARAMASREAVEQHLLDAFIPAAYRPAASRRDRRQNAWTASMAERWLVFLARHLEYTVAGPNFAWWQLERTTPPAVPTTTAAVVVTFGLGLTMAVTAGSTAGLTARLIAGIATGLVASCLIWLMRRRPARPLTGVAWSPRVALGRLRPPRIRHFNMHIFAVTFVGIAVIGLFVGLLVESAWLVTGPFALGIYGVYGDLAAIASPGAALARDRRSVFPLGLTGLLFGTAAGFVLGTASGRAARLLFGVADGQTLGRAAGLVFGVVFSLGFGVLTLAWPRWKITCTWLALHRRLPWRLMTFLEDAHKRGVLRQGGAMYQFRHAELQHRLATRP